VDTHVFSYAYVCVFICMYVYIYIYAHFFAASVACTLIKVSWQQCTCRCVCYKGVFGHQRTPLRTHSLQGVHMCVYAFKYVYMHAYVYGCVCASMMLLEALMHRW